MKKMGKTLKYYNFLQSKILNSLLYSYNVITAVSMYFSLVSCKVNDFVYKCQTFRSPS